MSATAPFADVARMLTNCAAGHTLRMATHSRVISFRGRTYRSFPKHDKIELGHIRKLVRYLQIDWDCASRHISQI